MLLSIQFPLADSRGFVEGSGRLQKPGWPLPTPDQEFIHNYGAIRNRPRGGLVGWIGENQVCEADSSIRLRESLRLSSEIPLRVPFRRYFFDGLAVGKLELGVATKSRTTLTIKKDDLGILINKFLNLKVGIRLSGSEFAECKLGYAGKHLAQSYLTSTTGIIYQKELEMWLIRPGTPLLFLDCYNDHDIISIPYFTKEVKLSILKNIKLYYCLVPFNGGTIRMWFLDNLSKYTAISMLISYL